MTNSLELYNDVHKDHEAGKSLSEIARTHKLQQNQVKAILKERNPILSVIDNMKEYKHNMGKRKHLLRQGQIVEDTSEWHVNERMPSKALLHVRHRNSRRKK